MKLLIAEDDIVYRGILEDTLCSWGYQIISADNGETALQILTGENAPQLAILDWNIPKVDGLEICRRVRLGNPSSIIYLIVLTAKKGKGNRITGLQSGADDYLTKPFDSEELQARLAVGVRIVDLQSRLAQQVCELKDALGHIKQLQGFLPICCYCKKVRNDQNYWQQVEAYIAARSQVQFTHGICPDCQENVVQPMLDEWERREDEKSQKK